MQDIIQLLPEHIANQIAAGEVIQRPSSAVKELLENAIDSGATEVRLSIRNAGKTMVMVSDNGCGMSEGDLRRSVERHATSKIRKAEDLFNIRTMGFRGEALASMAAVAQLEIVTKLPEEEMGTKLVIEGSEIVRDESCSAINGTTVTLKNLFYNVPARKNFLKSNQVETRHIIEEFQRIALANPGIGMEMENNGIEIFKLKPSNIRQRIVSVFGKNYNERLVPVEESTEFIGIKGFVGKPEYSRKTRGEQYFFINGRYIRHPYLNHAVSNAYTELIPKENYPFYVIYLDMDPGRIDINVHPTKQEVKFEDERMVYSILHASVKHALSKYSVTPSLDFEAETAFNTFRTDASPVTSTSSHDTGFKPMPSKMNPELGKAIDELHDIELPGKTLTIASDWQEDRDEEDDRKPFQMQGKFIVTQIRSGLMIIDQQAAHERVLYEQYVRSMAHQKHASQRQLFPTTVELTAPDAQILKELLEDIRVLGFDVQEFGANTFVVHGIPADISDVNEKEMLEFLIEEYKKCKDKMELDRRMELARILARSASIKSGQNLSEEEMRLLIDQLFACEVNAVSPSGHKTYITVELTDLEKQFKKD